MFWITWGQHEVLRPSVLLSKCYSSQHALVLVVTSTVSSAQLLVATTYEKRRAQEPLLELSVLLTRLHHVQPQQRLDRTPFPGQYLVKHAGSPSPWAGMPTARTQPVGDAATKLQLHVGRRYHKHPFLGRTGSATHGPGTSTAADQPAMDSIGVPYSAATTQRPIHAKPAGPGSATRTEQPEH